MLEKINPRELVIEKIKPHHKGFLTNFTSSNTELQKFLVEDAMRNQELGISTTYLWVSKNTGQVVAYATLLSDSLRIAKTDLEKIFVEKGVLYKSLPALKIGRLCVDDRFMGRGIGSQTTYFSIEVLLRLTDYIGCRFIVLDAKQGAVQFYRKLGFQLLKDGDKEIVPMYYDMGMIIELYRKGEFRLSSDFWKTSQ